MLRAFPARCRAAAALSLIAAACSYPTDNSAGAWVTIDTPTPVLSRGTDTVLTAHVYLLEHGKDTVEVKNIELTWSSGDPTLATVTALPGRTARVTGVNPGFVTITATAPALQSATASHLQLRISDPLSIDSVRPQSVRYGQELTVYGVGAQNVDALFLGSQSLILDQFFVGTIDTATGTSTRRFFVDFPTPARAESLVAIGNSFLAVSHDTMHVDITQDILDSSLTSPSHIDIDQHPYASTPTVAFFNPALYAEDPLTLPFKYDWFSFVTTHPDSAFTFIYIAPALVGRELTFLSAPVTAGTLASGTWTYGSGHYNCKGWSFTPGEEPNGGYQVAFTRLPPGGVQFVSLFVDRGSYQLIVRHGYFPANALTRPDKYAGDNTCDLADSNFVNPALRIDLSSPVKDTLSIDNGFGIDWLRFHVPGSGPQLVTVNLLAKAFTATPVRTPEINLYVTNVPTSSIALTVLKSALTGGTSRSLAVALAPGDYYLVAHDSVGIPAEYVLCMTIAASCILPPLPDVAAAAGNPESRALSPALQFDSLLAAAKKRRPRR